MFEMLDAVRKNRILVVLRGIDREKLIPAVEALYEGGIRMVEVTFDQSSATRMQDTARAIETIRTHMEGKLEVGAGTVLTLGELEAAHRAGARYMLAPNVDLGVLERAKELGMGAAPGAMTPSEAVEAYGHGADLVKIFPCDVLGPRYLKAIKAPLSHIPMLAMGGITAENLREYLAVADGVGASSSIAPAKLIAQGDFAAVRRMAEAFTRQLP